MVSIFLFAPCSLEGQDLEYLAARYERIVYEDEDPHTVNDALRSKAGCYFRLGKYQEALSTLSRVRTYLLDDAGRYRLLLGRELCSLMAGDIDSAHSFMQERLDAGQAGAVASPAGVNASAAVLDAVTLLAEDTPGMRNQMVAFFLSFIPPLGDAYAGHFSRGLGISAISAASVAWGVWQVLEKCYLTGILGGGLVLERFFMPSFERNMADVESLNASKRHAYAVSLLEPLVSGEISEAAGFDLVDSVFPLSPLPDPSGDSN